MCKSGILQVALELAVLLKDRVSSTGQAGLEPRETSLPLPALMLGLEAYATTPSTFLVFKNSRSLSKLTFEPCIYLGLKEDPLGSSKKVQLECAFNGFIQLLLCVVHTAALRLACESTDTFKNHFIRF